jgi:hypothetical protein
MLLHLQSINAFYCVYIAKAKITQQSFWLSDDRFLEAFSEDGSLEITCLRVYTTAHLICGQKMSIWLDEGVTRAVTFSVGLSLGIPDSDLLASWHHANKLTNMSFQEI